MPGKKKIDQMSFSKRLRKKRLDTGKEKWVDYYKKKHAKANEDKYDRVKDLPIDPNQIFFESFLGRCYADSPREIFETILNDPAYSGYHFVWSVNKPGTHDYLAKNPRVKVVERLSRSYYEAFCTSRYIINNITNNEWAKKKEGQTYIQTWHGTPLKRLGCDIEIEGGNGSKSRDDVHKQYRRESGQFDYLLSPSPYASEKLASAFDIPVEERAERVVELGYPRNVPLFTTTEEEKKYLRHLYGIPEGKKVVLYCTTWRENKYKYGSGYEYELQLRQDKLFRRFGDKACFLVRMHYNHRNTELDFAKYKGFLINGTYVEDVNRLFVIADALVTDYSSVMFDFANLKRPIVFYMYDRDAYENEIRGFYFDVSELPGPIVTNQDELEDALEKVLFEEFVPDEKYRAFNEKFNCLDDEKATERVIERLIPKKTEPDPVPEQLVKRREKQNLKRLKKLEKGRKAAMKTKKRRLSKSVFGFFGNNKRIQAMRYAGYYKKLSIIPNSVLYESNFGTNMKGPVFEAFKKALENETHDFTHIWVGKTREELSAWEKEWSSYPNVSFVLRESKEYFKLLARANYLVNNEFYPALFSKKDGQVYLNVWKDGRPEAYKKYLAWDGADPERITRELMKADVIAAESETALSMLDKKLSLGRGFNGRFVLNEDFEVSAPEKIPEVTFGRQSKTKLLIFCGKLSYNCETIALMNLLDEIDYTKFDVTLLAEKSKSDERLGYTERVKNRVRLLFRTEMPDFTLSELFAYRFGKKRVLKRVSGPTMDREWKRCFGNMTFDRLLDYSGERYLDSLLLASGEQVPRFIFAHTAILDRKKNTKAVNLYCHYTKVIAAPEVAEAGAFSEFCPAEKLVKVRPLLGVGRPLRFAEEAIWPNIKPNVDADGNRNYNFVAVSGFGPQDRTEQLVREFVRFHGEHPNSWLYILGFGPAYKYILGLTKSLGAYEYISLPKNVKNPYVVMKKCGCYIYAGTGENHKESIGEARLFGLPIVLTESIAARENMLPDGQLLISEKDGALLSAMEAYARGEVPTGYAFDPEKINKDRIKEFYTAIQCE